MPAGNPSRKKRDRWDSSSDEEEERNEVNRGDHSSGSCAHSELNNKEASTHSSVTVSAPSSRPNHDDNFIRKFRRHNPLLEGCRSVYNSYDRIARVDEGTYVSERVRKCTPNGIKVIRYCLESEGSCN